MNRIALIALAIIALSAPGFAHDGKHPDAPNPSPVAAIAQVVGYTNISIAYSRPGVKDREIWGKLVEYNEGNPRPWAAGANGSTVITFAEDIKINGNALKAGSYGLHMIPSDGDWTIIFSTDSSRFGIMKYTQEKDALRITATPGKAAYQEWLAYEFEKTGELTANLNMHWENLKVGFQIETPDRRKSKSKHDADHEKGRKHDH